MPITTKFTDGSLSSQITSFKSHSTRKDSKAVLFHLLAQINYFETGHKDKVIHYPAARELNLVENTTAFMTHFPLITERVRVHAKTH